MSAPKNTAGGATPDARSFVAVSMSLSELTPAEMRWVRAYRGMDQRRREENLDLAEADAMAHPGLSAPSGAHGIRLAAAFGKAVNA